MSRYLRPELMQMPIYAGAARWRQRTAKLRKASRAADRGKDKLTAKARAVWAAPGAPQLRKRTP